MCVGLCTLLLCEGVTWMFYHTLFPRIFITTVRKSTVFYSLRAMPAPSACVCVIYDEYKRVWRCHLRTNDPTLKIANMNARSVFRCPF